jgi:BirA family biotin operon repressor/biotin-[acetyl-CoA-carboxylase] ligase
VPGCGLALSVVLRLGCDVRQAGLIPLAAGVAAVRTAHALGVPEARLKWPNDVLVRGRKLAGVLCEMRNAPGAAPADDGSGQAVVIGVGMNVRHSRDELPEELREHATSLALEGSTAGVEDAAAAFLSALEPLWDELQDGDPGALLAEWSHWGAHWGEWVVVRTPAGPVRGMALRLDAGGGLVLRTGTGEEQTILAGDVTPSKEGCDVA